ncbi:MAG TPA: 3-oxoacyl-ACP reductase, partial [Gammaproteobacteria bacterium]|nr:3-oxoacyl-ACP reductase [Gammaproteobacteria bacterium]
MSEFNHQTIIITGAAGNLGAAVAQTFAAAGANIALVDIDEERLQQTQDDLAAGTQSIIIPTNLIDPVSVSTMVSKVSDTLGQIDILANIAGGFTMGPLIHETQDRDWDFMMNLNVRSVFNCCRAVIPAMLENGGGKIINISARAAREGKEKMGPYCASKAAVITLTETLSAENRDKDININCILPGTIDTPRNREDMPDADHSNWVPPQALADVIQFLASDAARCVTGAAIPVYGKS